MFCGCFRSVKGLLRHKKDGREKHPSNLFHIPLYLTTLVLKTLHKGEIKTMKKKLITLTFCLLLSSSVIAGCGKSDEQKARDEIMSHMDSDEKAAIASDQKEIEKWEEEQQEKQAELEAEQAALPEYGEDILDTIDIEWTVPLKVTFVSSEYLEEQSFDTVFKSKIAGLELTYNILSSDGGAMSMAKANAEQGTENAFYEEIGGYTIGGYDKGGNILTILITDTENGCLSLEFWTKDDEVRKDIYNRNVTIHSLIKV